MPDLRLAHCQDTQAPSDKADSLITTLMTIPTINPDPQKSLNTALGKYKYSYLIMCFSQLI